MVFTTTFRQHQQIVPGSAELGDTVLPELEGDIVGGIAAEAVNANLLDPESHRVNHRLAEVRVVEIQVGDVIPAGSVRVDDFTFLIVCIPVGMVFDPLVIPGCMVGDPVDDDCHPLVMGMGDKSLEIIQGAEFGIDSGVILDTIRTVNGFFHTDFADRHEPDGVGAKILDRVQAGINGLERILRREIAGVDLIHHNVLRGDCDITFATGAFCESG